MNENDWELALKRVTDVAFGEILHGNPNNRKAYVSGVYFALVVAMAYVESDLPFVDLVLWRVLEKCADGAMSVADLVYYVDRYSYGKMSISSDLVPNPGLRYGVPGAYYCAGVKDGINWVIMTIIPFLYKTYPNEAYKLFMGWVNEEMTRLNAGL